jgi:hypothetical protein
MILPCDCLARHSGFDCTWKTDWGNSVIR